MPSVGPPAVVHFGCGRLGTGAVLPFLIHQYGPSHTIFAVQRLSSKWERVPPGMLSIDTNVGEDNSGDTMPFLTRIIKPDGFTATSIAELLDDIKSERRILLLVPSIARCHELLKGIRQAASDLIVSCSLGEGQKEFIRMLELSGAWTKALIFENTVHENWSRLEKCHPIVVDRICWHVEPYSVNDGIISHCEKSKYVRFYWAESAGIPNRPEGTAALRGEKIDLPPGSLNPIPDNELDRQHKRKRALINAPHAIAAVLSYNVLASRRLSPSNQYLAPLQLMLQQEYPQWYQAMDHYLRLRAIQVAWSRFHNMDDQEQLHKGYLDAYRTAKQAQARFFETNDRLDRLMSADNFSKELSKLDEHIREPLEFYEKKRELIRTRWVYGRPTDVEFGYLHDFLYRSFIKAGQWLISSTRR